MTTKSRIFSLSLLAALALVLGSANLLAQSPPSGGQSQTGSSAPANGSSSKTTASAAAPKPQTPPAKSAGMVWVNTESGVYHKAGSRWYGKTKHGKYMLEADAIKAGYKPQSKIR